MLRLSRRLFSQAATAAAATTKASKLPQKPRGRQQVPVIPLSSLNPRPLRSDGYPVSRSRCVLSTIHENGGALTRPQLYKLLGPEGKYWFRSMSHLTAVLRQMVLKGFLRTRRPLSVPVTASISDGTTPHPHFEYYIPPRIVTKYARALQETAELIKKQEAEKAEKAATAQAAKATA